MFGGILKAQNFENMSTAKKGEEVAAEAVAADTTLEDDEFEEFPKEGELRAHAAPSASPSALATRISTL